MPMQHENEGGHDYVKQKENVKSAEGGGLCKKFGRFLLKYNLLIGLVLFVIIGVFWPPPGAFVNNDIPGQDICIAIIFFCSGLQLKTSEIKQAFRAWPAALYGLISILFLTPWLAAGIVALPYPVDTAFLIGFAAFCNAPPTLSQCVVYTKITSGNFPVALFLTTVTNLAIVLTVPFILPVTLKTLSSNNISNVNLDSVGLIETLAESILLPIVVGKALRFFEIVRRFAENHSLALKLTINLAIILLPWMNVSADVDQLKSQSAKDLVLVIALGCCINIIYLIFNGIVSWLLRFNSADRKAVVFASSQKAIAASIAISNAIPESLGAQGLKSISVVVAFISQAVINIALTNWWANYYETHKKDGQLLEDINDIETTQNNGSKTSENDFGSGEKQKSLEKEFGHRTSSFGVDSENVHYR